MKIQICIEGKSGEGKTKVLRLLKIVLEQEGWDSVFVNPMYPDKFQELLLGVKGEKPWWLINQSGVFK